MIAIIKCQFHGCLVCTVDAWKAIKQTPTCHQDGAENSETESTTAEEPRLSLVSIKGNQPIAQIEGNDCMMYVRLKPNTFPKVLPQRLAATVLQPIVFAIERLRKSHVFYMITAFTRECHLQSVCDSVNNQASVVLLNTRIQNTQFTHISSFKTKIRETTKAPFKCRHSRLKGNKRIKRNSN